MTNPAIGKSYRKRLRLLTMGDQAFAIFKGGTGVRMLKKFTAIAVLFLSVTILICGCGNNSDSHGKQTKPAGLITESVAITAKEALEFVTGLDEVREFIPEPMFIRINSTDSDDLPDINSGRDGKRRVWYVSIADRAGDKRASYMIVDKKIADVHSDDVANYDWDIYFQKGEYTVADIIIDSDEAIKIAVEEKGLQPGNPDKPENWLIGYHFNIGDLSVPADPLVIRVSGISPNGNLAEVTIDQLTGEILLAGEQTGYDETGHSVWNAF